MSDRWGGAPRAANGWRTVALLGLGLCGAGPGRRGQRRRRPCWWWATASRPSTASRAAAAGWRCSSSARQEKIAATVVNASVSGDTTGRALAPAALLAQHRPTHVLVELGGNDALRGLPLAMTRDNLRDREGLPRRRRQGGAAGHAGSAQLRPQIRRRVRGTVRQRRGPGGAALVPFLPNGVADAPNAETLFQSRPHPPAGHGPPRMLANVWPVLALLLK